MRDEITTPDQNIHQSCIETSYNRQISTKTIITTQINKLLKGITYIIPFHSNFIVNVMHSIDPKSNEQAIKLCTLPSPNNINYQIRWS